MTWTDELAALSTGGVIAAVLYWYGRRVERRLQALLSRLDGHLARLIELLDAFK